MEVRERYYRTLDSTNNEAKKQAQTHCPEGTVISAGRQTAGRGRRGHDWETPQDEAVATSMILYPDIPPEHLAAVAVRRAISGLYGLEGQIKWPNDVVLKNKKICGILTEMSAKDGRARYVIVGIGVNVHNRVFPEELADKARPSTWNCRREKAATAARCGGGSGRSLSPAMRPSCGNRVWNLSGRSVNAGW